MQHANRYDDAPSYGKVFNTSASGDQDFRVMNVSVAVLGLTGIEVDCKKKQKLFKKQKVVGSSIDKGSIGSSSSTESEDSNIKAVVTFFKNSNSSDTFIASHLPSLPIRSIDSSNSHYHATWPADFDPDGNELSTFKISRLMRTDYNQQRYMGGARGKNMFVPEEITLTIGLNKGSDMITLGSASLFVTEECEDIQVNLPVRLEVIPLQNGKKSKGTVHKPVKPTAFPKHPKTKYYLQNGYLKILLRAELAQSYVTRHSQDDNIMMDFHSRSASYDVRTGFTATPNRMGNSSHYNPNFTPGSSVGAVDTYRSRENNENSQNHVDDSSFDGTYDDTTTGYTYDTEKSGSKGILHNFLESFSSLCSAYPTTSSSHRNRKGMGDDESFVTIDGYENIRYGSNYGRRSYGHKNSIRSADKRRYSCDDLSYGPNSAHSVATQATQKIQNYRRDDEDPFEDLEGYRRGRSHDHHPQWL